MATQFNWTGEVLVTSSVSTEDFKTVGPLSAGHELELSVVVTETLVGESN